MITSFCGETLMKNVHRFVVSVTEGLKYYQRTETQTLTETKDSRGMTEMRGEQEVNQLHHLHAPVHQGHHLSPPLLG